LWWFGTMKSSPPFLFFISSGLFTNNFKVFHHDTRMLVND